MKIKSILLLLIGTAAIGQTPDKASFDQYWQALESNNKFMGSFSMSKNGQQVYARSVGFADVEKIGNGRDHCRFAKRF